MQRTTTNPSAGSTGNDSALQGATLAFRASPSPSPSNKNAVASSVTYGALAAASRAGTKAASPWTTSGLENKLIRTDTGNTSLTAGRTAVRRNSSQSLGYKIPAASPIERDASPSYLAATRAASRSRASVQPPDTSQVRKRMRKSPERLSSPEAGTDQTSIPSTNRLVELFEAKQKADLSGLNTSWKDNESVKQENILSPTPIRPSLSIRIRAPTIAKEAVPDPIKLKSPPQSPLKDAIQLKTQSPPLLPRRNSEIIPVMQDTNTKVKPAVPQPRRNSRPKSMQVQHKVERSMSAVELPSPRRKSAVKEPPQVPAPRRTRPVSAASATGTTPARTNSTPPILPRRLTNIPPSKLKPQLTADSLANAMVASSLASSRAPSPSKPLRSDPPSRQSTKSHSIASLFVLHTSPPPKLPPPRQQGLRQTLRRSPSTSSNEDSRHKNHHNLLTRKHPNKHAEGARRRWRDEITERERKRYEGVWAANKGLLLAHEKEVDSSADSSSDVHGYVVQDIWTRSGLGDRVLGEIWDLVQFGNSGKRRGRLKKEEFVVGMWLVDQCLKGRKLPVRVQDSVWDSTRGLMSGMRTR